MVSEQGSQYGNQRMIEHLQSAAHHHTVQVHLNQAIKDFVTTNPMASRNDIDNKLLSTISSSSRYLKNLKHVAMCYNDLKCMTISQRSFPFDYAEPESDSESQTGSNLFSTSSEDSQGLVMCDLGHGLLWYTRRERDEIINKGKVQGSVDGDDEDDGDVEMKKE